MDSDGERLNPSSSDLDVQNEHLARYAFAESLAVGKRVLDAGCGLGYGSARLAAVGTRVYAVDIAADPIFEARGRYPRVQFIQGDCSVLPLADNSLELVVAFEVIEHLNQWSGLIREAARVLDRSGIFLASTPNRSYYSTSRCKPNPFHVHEFEFGEFQAALEERFDHVEILCQNHVPAVALTAGDSRIGRAHFESPPSESGSAHFFVALCSQQPLEPIPSLAYVPDRGNILSEREQHIAKLNQWIVALEDRHARTEGRMSRELRRLPYRFLRRLRLAPQLPDNWAE